LSQAKAAVLILHGRGATAESILTLADELNVPDVVYLAPQAAGYSWYPYRFLAPLEANEPGLSSGLARIGEILTEIEAAGIAADRVVLLGFSQGACLTLEFAARNPRRYGGVVGLSGGLIGPPGTPREIAGSLAGTPVLLGCSDRDPHIPVESVEESADFLARLGGAVDKRIYPGMGHTVNEDELAWVREILAGL
jgi:predicted esterase